MQGDQAVENGLCEGGGGRGCNARRQRGGDSVSLHGEEYKSSLLGSSGNVIFVRVGGFAWVWMATKLRWQQSVSINTDHEFLG